MKPEIVAFVFYLAGMPVAFCVLYFIDLRNNRNKLPSDWIGAIFISIICSWAVVLIEIGHSLEKWDKRHLDKKGKQKSNTTTDYINSFDNKK